MATPLATSAPGSREGRVEHAGSYPSSSTSSMKTQLAITNISSPSRSAGHSSCRPQAFHHSSRTTPGTSSAGYNLLNIKQTILQRLVSTPTEKEEDLLNFCGWTTSLLGKVFTSHRFSGTSQNSETSSGTGEDADEEADRARVKDSETLRICGRNNRRLRSESPASQDGVGQEEKITAGAAGGSQAGATAQEVSMSPASDSRGQGEREQRRELETVSILLEFSHKAKEESKHSSQPAAINGASPGSTGHDSPHNRPSPTPSQFANPPTGRAVPPPPVPPTAWATLKSGNDVAIAAGSRSPASCRGHPLPSSPSKPSSITKPGTICSPPASENCPPHRVVPPPPSELGSAIYSHCPPSGRTSRHQHGPFHNTFRAPTGGTASFPRPISDLPSHCVYYMQAGCPHPEGVRAGRWTYFHGVGEKGNTARNVFMGQLLTQVGQIPSKVVAGIVRFNEDLRQNAALVYDLLRELFFLSPISQIERLVSLDFLPEESLCRLRDKVIREWVPNPKRQHETPGNVYQQLFFGSQASPPGYSPNGASGHVLLPSLQGEGDRAPVHPPFCQPSTRQAKAATSCPPAPLPMVSPPIYPARPSAVPSEPDISVTQNGVPNLPSNANPDHALAGMPDKQAASAGIVPELPKPALQGEEKGNERKAGLTSASL